MLVVDCCDDCPGPKSGDRCLPSTVYRSGLWLVDIIVVVCYAYNNQLKVLIFLKIGFLVIGKGPAPPNFYSVERAQKTLHPAKRNGSKYYIVIF